MKKINSRYDLKNISNDYYSTLNISVNTYSSVTLDNSNKLSQGYIFAPYIMCNSDSTIIDREIYKQLLREERIRKLNKISSFNE